ncbi:hypothetical protein HO173_004917 [Letharia columbiana]|uniref:Uncharacterized protein n=1 Tax=Letharia columbiana TaxID=112416 RepID=A0A8H6L678_9LECA|nr:uncharacterized protein HO173_004917 [Letharia columbiana]KAF6237038.1 hypothetical protein HO173_004917 [Letharia columbiana]
MIMDSACSEAGHGPGPRTRQRRKLDSVLLPSLGSGSKKRKLIVPKKDQDSVNMLAGYVSELKGMLHGLGIEDNNDVSVTADEATVTNADIYTVASPNGKWLPDSILRFVTQHFHSQFDPKGDYISLICPAMDLLCRLAIRS